WVTLAGGVLAVVAAAAGPVDVLAGGDGEGVADPAEVGDVEVALGQPLAEEPAVVGVGDAGVLRYSKSSALTGVPSDQTASCLICRRSSGGRCWSARPSP